MFWSAAAALSLAVGGTAHAAKASIHIPAGTLASALEALSRQAGVSIGFEGPIPRLTVKGLEGTIPAGAALDKLLEHTPWVAVKVGESAFRLQKRSTLPPPRAPLTARDLLRRSPMSDAEIIVTGSKRTETIAALALSITVIEPDNHPSDRRDSDTLLSETLGTVTTNLGPGRDRIFIRGVADSAFNGPTQSTVGVFLDDARINYSGPDPDLRLIDVERVEVLRGPQGALYGSGALGGIVRIVTRQPTEHWEGALSASGTSIAHGDLGGGLDAVLNVPLKGDRVAVRLVGYGERLPGWIDNRGTGVRDANQLSRNGMRVAVAWTPPGSWRYTLSFVGQWTKTRDSQYSDHNSPFTKSTAIAEPHDDRFIMARANGIGQVGRIDTSVNIAMVRHGFSGALDASAIAAALNLPAPVSYHERGALSLVTGELRFSRSDIAQPWVGGVSVLSMHKHLSGAFLSLSTSASARVDRDDAREVALFGEATQRLGRQFDLRIGLRAAQVLEESERAIGSDYRHSHVGLTPSATLAWRPWDGANLWLRYASATRPGGVTGRSDQPTFDSDHLYSLEAGWRLQFVRYGLDISGAIFGYRWRDLQSDTLGPDGLITTINAGSARNIGVEATTTKRVAEGMLSAGITVQKARLAAPIPGGDEDRHLPAVPDIIGKARIDYPFRVFSTIIRSWVEGRYIGRSRLSFDPLLGRQAGGYGTLDAGVSVIRGPWSFAVDGTNLADAGANSFAFGNPFSIRSTPQHAPIRPRTLTLSMGRKF